MSSYTTFSGSYRQPLTTEQLGAFQNNIRLLIDQSKALQDTLGGYRTSRDLLTGSSLNDQDDIHDTLMTNFSKDLAKYTNLGSPKTSEDRVGIDFEVELDNETLEILAKTLGDLQQ